MADAASRQRQLAAKVARRKVVAGQKMLEASSASLTGRIRVAAKGAVVRCIMGPALFDHGIGTIIVARKLPSGLIGCASFLLDVFCLGIKDVFYTETGQTELRSYVEKQNDAQGLIEIDPAYARKLIRDAAAYAASLGLAAAKDTHVIEGIFGDVDPAACTETFTFGRDGEPFFVSGPNDTAARIRSVELTLAKGKKSGSLIQSPPETL